MIICIVHGLIDEKYVSEMVANGMLFGFGYEGEPASFGVHKGNVWAAPKYAWDTDASFNNAMRKWVDNMVNVANGKYPNQIN